MKYIRDDSLDEVIATLARSIGYSIEIKDNESRKVIDTTNPGFKPSDYKALEVRMNDLLMKYEVFVVKKDSNENI